MTQNSASKLLNGNAVHRAKQDKKAGGNGFVKNHCLFQQKLSRRSAEKVRPLPALHTRKHALCTHRSRLYCYFELNKNMYVSFWGCIAVPSLGFRKGAFIWFVFVCREGVVVCVAWFQFSVKFSCVQTLTVIYSFFHVYFKCTKCYLMSFSYF